MDEERSTNIVLVILMVLAAIFFIGWLVDDVFNLDEPKPKNENQPQKIEWKATTRKRANQEEIEKAYNQIRGKSLAKIQGLGYAIEKEIMVTCDGEEGKAEYAVKERNYSYIGGEFKEVEKSKVYEITVRFRKYNDFEIINVELFDRGNNTVRTLE